MASSKPDLKPKSAFFKEELLGSDHSLRATRIPSLGVGRVSIALGMVAVE